MSAVASAEAALSLEDEKADDDDDDDDETSLLLLLSDGVIDETSSSSPSPPPLLSALLLPLSGACVGTDSGEKLKADVDVGFVVVVVSSLLEAATIVEELCASSVEASDVLVGEGDGAFVEDDAVDDSLSVPDVDDGDDDDDDDPSAVLDDDVEVDDEPVSVTPSVDVASSLDPVLSCSNLLRQRQLAVAVGVDSESASVADDDDVSPKDESCEPSLS